MSFPAKYDGRCRSSDCQYGDRQISPGDHVAYVEDELMHAVCAFRETDDRQKLDDAGPCPHCWEYHAGECA